MYVRPIQAYSEYAWLVNNKAELQKTKKKKVRRLRFLACYYFKINYNIMNRYISLLREVDVRVGCKVCLFFGQCLSLR